VNYFNKTYTRESGLGERNRGRTGGERTFRGEKRHAPFILELEPKPDLKNRKEGLGDVEKKEDNLLGSNPRIRCWVNLVRVLG